MLSRELCGFALENGLIAPGDRVTCAVSGGPDSMCMLRALYLVRGQLGITLSCAHFHHGLRSRADADEAFVRDYCAQYDIPFLSGRGDVSAEALSGESPEMCARRLRYAFLLGAADGLIATAHTADDNLETVLMRLTRGASPRGLGGIPVRQGRIIRPILFATRAQVLAFLAEEGMQYRLDETNDTDFCPRNRIRRHVVPLLREENPAVALRTLSLSRTLREEDAYLSALAAEALTGARMEDGWSCERLEALPEVLRRRALFAILQQSGVEAPTERHMEALSALVRSDNPSGRAVFPGNCALERNYDLLRVCTGAAGALPTVPLVIAGTTHLPGLRITCSRPKQADVIRNSPTAFTLRYNLIQAGIFARSRRTGDMLCLSGGSRSLKRLMIDRKIPASRRDRVPVLAAETGVAAVGGIGADVRYLAQTGEIAVEITIEKEDLAHVE